MALDVDSAVPSTTSPLSRRKRSFPSASAAVLARCTKDSRSPKFALRRSAGAWSGCAWPASHECTSVVTRRFMSAYGKVCEARGAESDMLILVLHTSSRPSSAGREAPGEVQSKSEKGLPSRLAVDVHTDIGRDKCSRCTCAPTTRANRPATTYAGIVHEQHPNLCALETGSCTGAKCPALLCRCARTNLISHSGVVCKCV